MSTPSPSLTSFVDIIKGNPSIVTRASAAHVVTTLTHQCPLDLHQFTGKLLSAFLSGLSDRSPAVRINFAGCIGHLMRTAKDSSREKLFTKLKSWYMEKDDQASRAAVAFTFQAVSRHNPDVMKSFASFAMPMNASKIGSAARLRAPCTQQHYTVPFGFIHWQ